MDVEDGNNGTLRNGVAFMPGHDGQAFYLDGIDDYVEVPHSTNLDPGNGSFAALAWIRTMDDYGNVLCKYECGRSCPPGAASTYRLMVEDGRVRADLRDSDEGGHPDEWNGQILTSTKRVDDDRFHLVDMVRDMASGQFLI